MLARRMDGQAPVCWCQPLALPECLHAFHISCPLKAHVALPPAPIQLQTRLQSQGLVLAANPTLLFEHSQRQMFYRYLKGVGGYIQATCYKISCKTSRSDHHSHLSDLIWMACGHLGCHISEMKDNLLKGRENTDFFRVFATTDLSVMLM